MSTVESNVGGTVPADCPVLPRIEELERGGNMEQPEGRNGVTFSWVVGICVMIIGGLLGYILNHGDSSTLATQAQIESLRQREAAHDIEIAVLKTTLDQIKDKQERTSRSIDAISRKLGVVADPN
jgi:hypothetical protein